MKEIFWLALAAAMAPCLFLMFLHWYRLVSCCWTKDPEVEELEKLWRRSA